MMEREKWKYYLENKIDEEKQFLVPEPLFSIKCWIYTFHKIASFIWQVKQENKQE